MKLAGQKAPEGQLRRGRQSSPWQYFPRKAGRGQQDGEDSQGSKMNWLDWTAKPNDGKPRVFQPMNPLLPRAAAEPIAAHLH